MKPSRHPDVGSLPPSTIARIRQYNTYDIELYKFGEQIFDELLQSYRAERAAGRIAPPQMLQSAPRLTKDRRMGAGSPRKSFPRFP
jgi:hypothetical protein